MRNSRGALWVLGGGLVALGCTGGLVEPPGDSGAPPQQASSGGQGTTQPVNPLRRVLRPDLEPGDAVEGATSGPPDSSSQPDIPTLPHVTAYFPRAGALWNDWVAGGPGVLDASDTACLPESVRRMDECVHGGEARTVAFPNVAARCDNVTITDALDVFDWTCKQEGNTLRAISLGLKTSPVRRGLSDLVTYINPPSWRQNRVLVHNLDGTQLAASAWSRWWHNTVIEDSDGWGFGEPNNAIRVVLHPDRQQIPFVMVEKQALVVRPDAPVQAGQARFLVGNATPDTPVAFIWMEGPFNLRTYDREGRIAFNLGNARFVTLRNVTVHGFPVRHPAASIAVLLTQVELMRVQGLKVDGASVALQFQGFQPRDLHLEDVALRNVGEGLVVLNAQDLRLNTVTVEAPCSVGVDLTGTVALEAKNLTVVGCLNEGVSILGMQRGSITGLRTFNNSVGLHVTEAHGLLVRDVQAINNTSHGIWATNTVNTLLQGVLTANNAGHGVLLSSGESNLLMNITAANNGTRPEHSGIQVLASDHTTITGLAALNNTGYGVNISGGERFSEGTTLGNALVANNARAGVNLAASAGLKTFGLLRLGSNDGGDCGFDPGVANALVPGGTRCAASALASGTTLEPDRSALGALLGPMMVPDPLRLGYHIFPEREGVFDLIQDFVTFAQPMRAFAVTADALFGRPAQRGPCLNGHACQIHDFRTRAGRNAAGVQPEPTLSDQVRHPWMAMTQMACAELAGATWDGADCTADFLPGAVEMDDLHAGNHNGLCENGERCLLTPNAGAYQGTGLNLIPWAAATGPQPRAWGVILTRRSEPAVP